MRRSTYTIDVPCAGYHLWINSLTGAIDKVPDGLARQLAAPGGYDRIDAQHPDIQVLQQRGHLTASDAERERAEALDAWQAIDSVHRRTAKVVICPSIDCNFRCTYCFESPLQARIDDGSFVRSSNLTTRQVDQIFDSLDALREHNEEVSSHITLFGGEPLWARNRKVVEAIVAKARERGFSLSAITNGHDLDAFMDLLGSDGIARIQVSLDGPRQVHDSMRPLNGGGATFDRIVRNLVQAVEIDSLNVSIRMNYDQKNMPCAGELHDELSRLGIIPRPNVDFHANLISMNHEGKGKDYATIKQYKDTSQKIPNAELDCYTTGLRRQFVNALDTGAPLARRAHFCSATSGMYVFCPDGRIYSCWEGIGEDHSWIGSFGSGIEWRMPVLQAWHGRTAPAMEKCQKCSHLFLCGGGCTVHAIEQNRPMTTSQCDGLKKKFEYMVQKVMDERDVAQQPRSTAAGGERVRSRILVG